MKIKVQDLSSEVFFGGATMGNDTYVDSGQVETISGSVQDSINYVHTHISEHLSRLADTTDAVIMSNRFSRSRR